jgi:hypothetical protein
MTARDVYIEHKRGSWLVIFSERLNGSRFLAAQFNDTDSNLTKVTKWVNDNEKLNLIQKT